MEKRESLHSEERRPTIQTDQALEHLIQESLTYKLILQMKLDRMVIQGDLPIKTIQEWALVRKSIKA